jgi:uncharacterized protein
MNPKERMQEDLKAAMKAGDSRRKDAIRFLTAAIKQIEIDSRETVTDEQVYSILNTELKKRRDTLTEAEANSRAEMAEQSRYEITLIESYLPQQLTREELEAEVRKAIEESGAKSAKEMGAVMKVLMPRVKNRADGKLVNDVVKAALSS